jgi:endoglucanase
MNPATLPAALLFATLPLLSQPPPDGAPVRVNSIGFQPPATKHATIATGGNAPLPFRILRLPAGEPVFTGTLGPPKTTPTTDTGETLRLADFSALTTPGHYQLDITGLGRSAPFDIARDIWNTPFHLVARAIHLMRCGCAVRAEWQGRQFAHPACHLDDGWLDPAGKDDSHRDATGGWHDAGDYNKYTLNTAFSAALLLTAWEHFHPRIAPPGTDTGTPDLLAETRWGLEWLLKMQTPDGRAHHKLSALTFHYWGPPGHDREKRYFSGWGTAATASLAAVTAHAAHLWRGIDPAFARRCLAAARLAWRCLETHPQNTPPAQTAFATGAYACDDKTHRLWAAAALWRATGEPRYLADFETRARAETFSHTGPGWADVRDLALGLYLETEHTGHHPALATRLRADLLARAHDIAATARADAHGRPLGGGRQSWTWGGNGALAAQTYLLHLADRAAPDPAFRAAAASALDFLFGRNFHARSYITGLGHNPPRHPHDRRGEPAWPGCLVGGGTTSGRSWTDDKDDYRQNEIALNWNAALLYALAAFVEPPLQPLPPSPPSPPPTAPR